jgi:hypothetical protein
MIKAHCHTNLDDYDCSLVTVFAGMPVIGHYVTVMYKGQTRYLKIVSIRHDQKDNEPYLFIELHK